MNGWGLELPELAAIMVIGFMIALDAWALRVALAIDRERDSISTRDKV
jgi:hypothetical protein